MANKIMSATEKANAILKDIEIGAVLPAGPGNDTESFRRAHDPSHTVAPTEAVFHRPLRLNADRFIIVGAQNATPVDPEFWPVLSKAVEVLDAELLVIPLRYKNPTSIWSQSQANAERWAVEVQPYLWNQRYKLNDNLTVMADIKIPPTKSSPLSGFDAMSGVRSAIFAHPKLHMKTVPTPANTMAKLLTTTGVCTKENYTDSGLGKISQFHHSLSAIYVELDGNHFYLTQLHFDKVTKSITHLDRRFTASGVEPAPRALALVMGDTHVGFVDPKVETARFGTGGLLEQVNPTHLIWHDTLDSYSCNPHDRENPFIQYANEDAGRSGVRKEVERAVQYIADHTPRKGRKSVVVSSNHDDMLSRWIKKEDWKKMGSANADFYLETALAMKRGAVATELGVVELDPFVSHLRAAKLPNVQALDVADTFTLADVVLHLHGDDGPNGSRGSIHNLRRIGSKVIKGHDHTPGIDEGCYSAGTSSYLKRTWLRGPSGWLNADVLLNADGKRQVIIYIDGRYRK